VGFTGDGPNSRSTTTVGDREGLGISWGITLFREIAYLVKVGVTDITTDST
jgi:hypothetical protein